VRAVADAQFGRVSAAQLSALGVPSQTVSDWLRSDYLIRVLPRVYAVGHAAKRFESELSAACSTPGRTRCSVISRQRGGAS
jgi:hypothetical protein